jgi:hypothetical protein
MVFVELARTIYIRCIYGNFGRGITKYTVIYGAKEKKKKKNRLRW